MGVLFGVWDSRSEAEEKGQSCSTGKTQADPEAAPYDPARDWNWKLVC